MTVKDVKTGIKIWGPLLTKAKGNTVRQPAKANPMSIVSEPKELLQAQKKVTLSIHFFYINQKHIFMMMYSENICFTTNIHVFSQKVKDSCPFSRTYTKSIWYEGL